METAELTSSIEGLVAVDVSSLTDDELATDVVALVQLRSRFDAVIAGVTAEWDNRELWREDGSLSPGARLGRDVACSADSTKAVVTRSRKLRTMPLTEAAYRSGEISTDHVDELARANRPDLAELFLRDEKVLLDAARDLPFPDFRLVVRHWRNAANDEASEGNANRSHERRRAHSAKTLDGEFDIGARLDPVNGAIYDNELRRLAQQLFEEDWAAARAEHGDDAAEHHLARTSDQRRADAMVEMARRSAAQAPGSVPARPLVTIVCGLETFKGRICELADGTVLTPGQVGVLLGEADFERIVFASPSRVIDVSKTTRFFTGALRRAIEVRDRHCTFPGCTIPADRCQVDHIVEHTDGGETTQVNGRLLCPAHNRQRPGRSNAPPSQGP